MYQEECCVGASSYPFIMFFYISNEQLAPLQTVCQASDHHLAIKFRQSKPRPHSSFDLALPLNSKMVTSNSISPHLHINLSRCLSNILSSTYNSNNSSLSPTLGR
ncbi:hypothetical protein PoB_005657500 [Plakobranchus ocellatus]|uniref:Uncharacterized protein n=1 Tax=Plakobranchus ocellatus TaxID=259542 RepID=A0AAV4CBF6_9GAST|nr:hypothetical protein PoB_005657500 [Plakobranchus ocellatus]